MAARGEHRSARMERVWDPLVRTGHWVLVAGFATAYLSEGEPEWLHVWAGYAIAITVALRILWGCVGPRRARFSDFVTGPVRVLGYLRDLATGRAPRHLGHSPAGGAMTLALLAALALTAVSGMATLAVEEGRGPLAGIVAHQRTVEDGSGAARERDEAGAVWEDVHEFAANLTLVLIVLHVAGVALASYAHRENLVRAMVTGAKRALPGSAAGGEPDAGGQASGVRDG
ncbi:MAG: cytochrome b/b6 domain-containing protein [Nitratireductor sp.]